MAEKILFVDDEPAVLDGYKRMLYRDFDVQTAVGGAAGLEMLRQRGPFAVVVSDMRMPGMSGAQFLAQARALAPHTVRMLLTGYSDMQDATAAVNDGNIFRYLQKPCGKEALSTALQSGLSQHHGMRAEKELLEGTLLGSIRALSEVLSAISPEAFARSSRVTACVRHLAAHTLMEGAWRVQAAAMLSQLGCLALPPELLRAAHHGDELPAAEQARFNAHPSHARELIAHIPRMEPVAWIIGRQIESTEVALPADLLPGEAEALKLGGEMLRLGVAYDTLWLRGTGHEAMVLALRQAVQTFPPQLLNALETMKPVETSLKPARLPVGRLQTDMIVNEDVRNVAGALLVGAGQPISTAMLMKLREYAEDRKIVGEISVLVSTS